MNKCKTYQMKTIKVDEWKCRDIYVVFFTEVMYFEMHVAFVFIYCLLISMTWIDAYCL